MLCAFDSLHIQPNHLTDDTSDLTTSANILQDVILNGHQLCNQANSTNQSTACRTIVHIRKILIISRLIGHPALQLSNRIQQTIICTTACEPQTNRNILIFKNEKNKIKKTRTISSQTGATALFFVCYPHSILRQSQKSTKITTTTIKTNKHWKENCNSTTNTTTTTKNIQTINKYPKSAHLARSSFRDLFYLACPVPLQQRCPFEVAQRAKQFFWNPSVFSSAKPFSDELVALLKK